MMVILLGMPHYAAFSRFVRLIGFTLHYRILYVYQVYYLRSTLLAVLLIVFHQDDRHTYYIHAVRFSKSIVFALTVCLFHSSFTTLQQIDGSGGVKPYLVLQGSGQCWQFHFVHFDGICVLFGDTGVGATVSNLIWWCVLFP